MRAGDMLEFYDGKNFVAVAYGTMVPPVGSLISIRGETWRVVRVTYALDNVDDPAVKRMRANVGLEAT